MPITYCKPGQMVPFTYGASGKGWHSLEAWLTCPKEGQLKHVRKLRQRGYGQTEAFAVGSLLHAARAQWLNDHRQGGLWKKAIIGYAEGQAARGEPAIPNSMLEIARKSFATYAAYWKLRPTTRPLAVEYELKPRGVSPTTPEWAWRTARYDSIEFHNGKAWIGEFKTSAHGESRVRETYSLHGQPLLQMALWGEDETKKFGELGGVLLDVLEKASGTTDGKAYPRMTISVTEVKHALEWFKRDLISWQMQVGMVDWNTRVERRPACMRQYGPCHYRDLCKGGERAAIQYESEVSPGVFVSAHKLGPSPGRETPVWE